MTAPGPDRFAELRAQGVRRVAVALGGFELDDAPRRGLRPCPACGENARGRADRRPPAEVTSDGLGWSCYRCGAKGDAVALAALAVAGSPKPADWRPVLARCAAEGLCPPMPGEDAPPAPRRPLPPPPVPGGPRTYRRPPPAEVADLWGRCLPATDDAEVSAWLRSRGLDAGEVEARDLARALPVAGALPAWARYRGASWREAPQRFRVVVPMYGAGGALESLHARALAPVDPKGRDKAAAVADAESVGLVFADALGRLMLAGAPAAELVRAVGLVVAEGEPAWLAWATAYGDADAAPAVLGIVAGSWTAEVAARVPDGTRVTVDTDRDDPKGNGDRYAEEVRKTLASRCEVRRVRWRKDGDGNQGR